MKINANVSQSISQVSAEAELNISFYNASQGKRGSFEKKILTSNRLSKLAFLKEEVTELASFSSIHALKSLTAKEAAIPTEE